MNPPSALEDAAPGGRRSRPLVAAVLLLAALAACEGATGPEDAPPEATILHPRDSVDVANGDTVRFEGTAEDEEEGQLPGRRLVWSSDIDGRLGSGARVAVGGLSLGPHEITLTATDSAGNRDEARVKLYVYRPPVISSVTSPLPETSRATIEGRNFSPDPADMTVRVDGVPATVEEAGTHRLVVSVPDLGCVPPGARAEVTVGRRGREGEPYAVGTEPEESPLSLSPGSQEIITDRSDFCLQLPASSAPSEYLVGVQSITRAAESLTPVRVVSRTPRPESDAGALSPSRETAEVTGGGEVSGIGEVRRAHRRAELELRRREREEVDLAADMLPPGEEADPRISLQISDVSAGDTIDVRVPGWPGDDPCDDYVVATGVVEVVGAEGIVVQDTAAPAPSEGGYTRQDLEDFSQGLDARIPAVEAYFGSPGDRDGNGRVVAFFTPATTRGEDLLGFVYSGDLTDRSACAASSEGEIFYGRVPDDDISAGRLRYVMPATIQHELTHVIQVSRRGEFLATHLSEAQATLSEEISGHADADRETYGNYGSEVALDPDRSDRGEWYSDKFRGLARYFGYGGPSSRVAGAPEECGWWRESSSPCVSRALWYDVGWSFLRWVSDTHGPDYPGGEQQLHRDIIADPDRGLAKVADLVGSERHTLLARWAAALYLDDRVDGLQDGLAFSSWDLHDVFAEALGGTAELRPYEAGFSSWQEEVEVRASSTAYFRVSGPTRPATAVAAEPPAGGSLPSSMQLWVVRLR